MKPRVLDPGLLKPMEAEAVDELPSGGEWSYEPKYDGFRCLAWHDGVVDLRSKIQKPLSRYFPELAEGLAGLSGEGFVIDGEIVIPDRSFETLQLRLHPARSRIARLSKETPAMLIAFDILMDGDQSFIDAPFEERRTALEAFCRKVGRSPWLSLSKSTRSMRTACGWLDRSEIEGIVAKRLDLPYRSGERAMQKFKKHVTIDCVVGGLYLREGTEIIDSLLLGLYDEEGRLNYVGRAPIGKDAAELGKLFKSLIGGDGFTGRAPGGKSRWSGKEHRPIPIRPQIVLEVSADRITNQHFRHGAKILRVRDDKRPEDCTVDQLPD